jgi:signal transduction histidine kinase
MTTARSNIEATWLHQDDEEHLPTILIVTAVLCSLLAGLMWYAELRAEGTDLTPFGFVAAGVLSGALLFHKNLKRAAAIAYLVFFSLGISLYVAAQLAVSAPFILLTLPTILGLLLLRYTDLTWLTMVTFGATIIFFAWQGTLTEALVPLFIAAATLAAAVITLVVFSWTKTMQLEWALSTKDKDTRRAEDFYGQSEKLARALREVQWYSAQLEHANRELEEARRIAEVASNAKSTFLSNMSHELRTPLNMVIGYTSSMLTMPQMYGNKALPEVYRGDIELIQSSGQHLLGLINDVLDLSKIEAGKLELQFASTDLKEIFNGVIATATGLTKDKPVQLRQDFSSDLPRVWADSLRVRQVLLNLLSNAIKFTDTGSVTLRARVEGQYVNIAVIDTGIGIPEDALKTIFERYEQVRGQKSSLGTGLGLDISQRLAEMHGTRLMVESIYGQGSTFAFQLPLTTPEQDLERVPTLPSRSAMGIKIFATAAASSQTLAQSILLIEDESKTRKQIHDALEAAGHLVVDAHEGSLALELAVTLQPDLILLDAQLSGTNANEMLRALAENPVLQGIPVILLGEPVDATPTAYPFLSKPIQINALEQAVQATLYQSA